MSSKPAHLKSGAYPQPWPQAWSHLAVHCAALPVRLGSETLRAPFDALRWAHAASANAGWLRRSLRESAAYEHALMALERALLGPLARRR